MRYRQHGITVRREDVEKRSSRPRPTTLLIVYAPTTKDAIAFFFRHANSVGVLGENFSASSVLMVGEIIKLVVSIFMTLADSGTSSAQGSGLKKLWWLMLNSVPMAVPAVVFWLMNLLSYVSLQRIDASTFTVCAQVLV